MNLSLSVLSHFKKGGGVWLSSGQRSKMEVVACVTEVVGREGRCLGRNGGVEWGGRGPH